MNQLGGVSAPPHLQGLRNETVLPKTDLQTMAVG